MFLRPPEGFCEHGFQSSISRGRSVDLEHARVDQAGPLRPLVGERLGGRGSLVRPLSLPGDSSRGPGRPDACIDVAGLHHAVLAGDGELLVLDGHRASPALGAEEALLVGVGDEDRCRLVVRDAEEDVPVGEGAFVVESLGQTRSQESQEHSGHRLPPNRWRVKRRCRPKQTSQGKR